MALFHLFKSYSERELKKIAASTDKIESFRQDMIELSDTVLAYKTDEFKNRLCHGETTDDILPEAFAVVREVSRRVLGKEPYKVQLMGGIGLFSGNIVEARTGEGKTLMAALPSYLEALNGNGVHVVTVNDYLAKRDADEIGQIHRFLGLTVGCVTADMEPSARKDAYNCDITYVTNNELGFDYLRDNMAVSKDQRVLRGLNYAIIDEADSILIDEARTPLIISANSGRSTEIYGVCDLFVKHLKRGNDVKQLSKIDILSGETQEETGDYIVNEKDKIVTLTTEGVRKAEKFFRIKNLADLDNLELQHCITMALRANSLMKIDKDYIVRDGSVLIVDEFTGRVMAGRRFSDGLHQAIEAKENVDVNQESVTAATITFQNFFNKFQKKCGMTGTAITQEKEFKEVYNLGVVVIPTNKPVIRKDCTDSVYKTKDGKYRAVIREVKSAHEVGQPVLVGTATIKASEELSSLLSKEGISHHVLNAKNHALEAEIISHAGEYGAVTIATNMAGRGTDIILDDRAREAGGLYVIGTERHESRRVDNQLRGRSGRQGDPGKSKFFISLEDDLMRLFGSDKLIKAFNMLGIADDEEIKDKTLTKAVESAQKKVEDNNYGIRKTLLEYDDVMNFQRDVIYAERDAILNGGSLHEQVLDMIKDVTTEEYDAGRLNGEIPDEIVEAFKKEMDPLTNETLSLIEGNIALKTIDLHWMRHIDNMAQLKASIGLQAYAQKDPVAEYKIQGNKMYDDMIYEIRKDIVNVLMHMRISVQQQVGA